MLSVDVSSPELHFCQKVGSCNLVFRRRRWGGRGTFVAVPMKDLFLLMNLFHDDGGSLCLALFCRRAEQGCHSIIFFFFFFCDVVTACKIHLGSRLTSKDSDTNKRAEMGNA
eukprot:scaffold3287_cov181-Amphora_coffeaeformis.AAC.10